MNGMMLQGFSWYLPSDGQHWRRLAERAPELAARGFTAVWLPPAYKGQAGKNDVGYGVYDLWDLGEFDQKDSVNTKYGEKDDYLACIKALQAEGIQVLGDIVLNHKMGGDELEEVEATEVDPANRTVDLEEEPTTIQTWSRFTFPGRNGQLDSFIWDASCFTGTDWNEKEKRSGLWRFGDKHWAADVDHSENGNFDYLMGENVDLSDERVYEQLVKWGKWYLQTTGIDGLRLDALKHMSRSFYQRWIAEMRASVDHELFVVGEYWSHDLNALRSYIGEEETLSLFDVPLHFNFFNASQNGEGVDFTHLFDGSLVSADPIRTVTFVENHDTQPDQALESTVHHWFKPAAYALILLREAGYPCVFFADLFGLPNDGIPAVAELPLLMEIRMNHAFGRQCDYFDEPDIVGWTRQGSEEGPGCAVVLSRRDGGEKLMEVGTAHAGEHWVCVLGEENEVTIGDDGFAVFPAASALTSVYLPEKDAEALSNIPIIVRPNHE
ncbi:MAG: alpha-amylase [Coriobacteriales bacterium]|nr:alpha-amylase [Coriobacteriales bacterium]